MTLVLTLTLTLNLALTLTLAIAGTASPLRSVSLVGCGIDDEALPSLTRTLP